MFQTMVFMVFSLSLVTFPFLGKKWFKWIVAPLTILLFLLYFGFFIWQQVYPSEDEEYDTYKWQSPPGITMLCLRTIISLLFTVFSFLSFGNGGGAIQVQKLSQMLVALIICAWFFNLPVIVSIAALMPFYYRWKMVLSVSQSVNIICYTFFALVYYGEFSPQLSRLLSEKNAEESRLFEEEGL